MRDKFMCEVTVDILTVGWVWLSFVALMVLAYLCLDQMLKISRLRMELASLKLKLEGSDQ